MGYNDSSWGDRLTSWQGVNVTYDEIGNPTWYSVNYLSCLLTWNGRQLTSFENMDGLRTYTYNDEGIRIAKNDRGTLHTYQVDGIQIVSETWGNHTIFYVYDEMGSIAGMRYRTSNYAEGVFDEYLFEKNLQGDVVAIYNASGTKLVSYTYDAWGKVTTTYSNGGASTAVQYNPFRFRGYYYDEDTGLYYLNSRYYDPSVGRFISADVADVIALTPDALTDKNLYAYCDNNPIMRKDDGGEFWNFIIGGVVGAVVGGVVAALNGEDTAGIIIGALSGAASGVVAATGLGLLAQAGVSAGISASADFANQTVDIVQDGGTIFDYNIGRTLNEAALGFVTSAAGTILGNFVDAGITNNLAKSKELFKEYLGKTFTAGLKKEAGRSTSALIKQANKFLGQSNFYLNVYRGVSSVVGSVVSLWNIAR